MGDAPLPATWRPSTCRALKTACGTRSLVIAACVLASFVALPASGNAQAIRNGAGKLISCPDPSVVNAPAGRYRYYLACTSDHAANAFPLRASNDLLHWRQVGYIFPKHRQPWWALHSPQGRFWAPAIYRIGSIWVIYFAAQYNAKKLSLRYPGGHRIPNGEMIIGVATAQSLSGPWHTKVLHYRGQFNRRGIEQERYGGVIDPSMVHDPLTGQRYLFWAEQHSSIWVSRLSASGVQLDPHVHQALWTIPGWDCDTPNHKCTIEGPEEFVRNGWFYLFYSGASTWSGTYAVGVAVSTNPLDGQFKRLSSEPILTSGHGWIGPGGTSAPVVAPNGEDYIFYHAETRPNPKHNSALRYLLSSPLNWDGTDDLDPLISP
jgi:arabinan endo-1,5-alpha-L-arabinosidase